MSTPQDAKLQILEEAAAKLSAHFESIQLFATDSIGGADGDTTRYHTGRGNLYARIGQVEMWIECSKEKERVDTRKEME